MKVGHKPRATKVVAPHEDVPHFEESRTRGGTRARNANMARHGVKRDPAFVEPALATRRKRRPKRKVT